MISNIEDIFLSEFSYNQKVVWKNGVDEQSNLYSQTILDFRFDLDKKRLLGAIQKVVERYEMLSFIVSNEVKDNFPFQESSKDLKISYFEVESVNETDLQQHLNFPYNPNSDAPIKFGLVTESGYVKRLYVKLYALWGDTYSNLLFIEDLKGVLKDEDFFNNNIRDRIPYSKYSDWYDELISESDEEALSFWDSYDFDSKQIVLPFASKGNASFMPQREQILKVEAIKFIKIKEYCVQNNVQLSDVILTLFSKYLQEFTDNEISLGYFPLKRNYGELDNTFGVINRTVPVKITNQGNDFSNFLNEVVRLRNNIEETKLWSDYFLIDINKCEEQTVFPISYEFLDLRENNNDDIIVSDLYNVQDKFEIKITCFEYQDSLAIELYYDNDKISQQDFLVIESQLKNIFDSFINNQNFSIALSKYEKSILSENNNTSCAHDMYNSIVNMFDKQALKYSGNDALIEDNKRVTYKELLEKSNQFANYLLNNLGVTKGDAICVLTSPSENFIITILGILKAGAYYVPIDHNYPNERVQYILNDCQTRLLVSDIKTKEDTANLDVEILNPNDSQIFQSEKITPKQTLGLSDIVYCIYTSGSTGNPKGCIINNGNLLNYIQWANEFYFKDENEGDWGLITSVSFDLTVTSIFTSLTRGRKLWIGDSNKDSGQLIQECFNNKEIDTLKLTPSHLTLLKEIKIGSTSIRTVICGGEQLTKSQVRTLKSINEDIRIFNEYGPTETTVGCIVTEVHEKNEQILIGKPIANTKIYIVDAENRECLIGSPGELVIEGQGVSVGYYNRPELTSSKFENNFLNTGNTAYRTGDIARWLPNGDIEYLGRKDNQVKIRGYRIELEDIENKLLSFESIRQSVVIIEEDDEENKQLTAFIVSDEDLKISELRPFLLTRIPEYMIPSNFVQIDKIPLTVNGKVDKEKLIKSKSQKMKSGVKYLAPSTEVELKIAELWQEILQKDRVSVNDDFFVLGGHSLKAIKLINEYYKRLGIKLSLKQLFDNTTLISHAELLSISNKSQYQEIEKLPEMDSYQVSDGQRRIWMLSQFEESSIAYNMPTYVELKGSYNKEGLSTAINRAIKRHEILRTVYRLNTRGELTQKIIPTNQVNFKLQFFDYTKEKDKETIVKDHMQEDSRKPFDLYDGPLLRANLYQLEDDKFILYYNLHHIVGDSWSMDILQKEVLMTYESILKNEEPKLPELKVQYKDYAAWKLKQLEGDSYIDQKKYWLNLLSGELPTLDLINSNQRPKIKTYNGNTLSILLTPEFTTRLKTFCKSNGGSSFMVLLSFWNTLFSKYTSKRDIIIGSPVACRNHKDLESQIGFYLNTLALRNSIDPDLTFISFYEQIKKSTSEAFKNQSYPFDRLVTDLKLKQDVSRNAIFDAMLTFQTSNEIDTSTYKDDNEYERIVDLGPSLAKFDIDISFLEQGDNMILSINYNTDIYKKFFIENLINNFVYLSKAVLERPENKIIDFPFVTIGEIENLTKDFNKTKQNRKKVSTVLELFKENVKAKANINALVFEDNMYTYEEIDNLSNQFASYLIQNFKIKIGDIVGLKADRSEWTIISILGILKSGAVYLPISPSFPQERLDYIKADSNYTCCITNKEISDFILRKSKYLDSIPSVQIKADDLAYIIYTSGTTGNPKGVMISHDNLTGFIPNIEAEFKFNKGHKLAATTNITFDISVLEIIGGLCTGKELHVFSDELLMDPKAIINYIENRKIDLLQLTPSRLAQLYNTQLPMPDSLKVVLVGGEAMHDTIYDRLLEEKFEAVNVYGPTEATIWSTSLSIKESRELSIGKPLQNEEIYIVNSNHELQPIGVVGELCIGGCGVAKGYLNKPDLTQEKFVTNPWVSGEKMYKTGDLARWNPDGNLEFFGRKDDQVKIRGYRIELGEIENALLQYDAIEEAITLVKTNDENEKSIIAFLVSSMELNTSDVRAHLNSIIPNYMIPSEFIQLDRFPLTSSGKIDRNALNNHNGTLLSSGNEYEAPRDEQEYILVEILSKHLERDSSTISIHDNFFDLGANSLMMIKILGVINEEFKTDLKVVTLFEYSSISELVGYFQSLNTTDDEQEDDSNISEDLDEILDLI